MLAATRTQLEEAGGEDSDVCALISAARELVEFGLCEDLQGTPVDMRDQRLLRYLQVQLGNRRKECLYVIFVDDKCNYIRGETCGSGSASNLDTRLGLLFRRAIELRAAGFILAHNHPSGDHRPSKRDVTSTRTFEETANRLDFVLLDHLIVTRSEIYSIKQERTL